MFFLRLIFDTIAALLRLGWSVGAWFWVPALVITFAIVLGPYVLIGAGLVTLVILIGREVVR